MRRIVLEEAILFVWGDIALPRQQCIVISTTRFIRYFRFVAKNLYF